MPRDPLSPLNEKLQAAMAELSELQQGLAIDRAHIEQSKRAIKESKDEIAKLERAIAKLKEG